MKFCIPAIRLPDRVLIALLITSGFVAGKFDMTFSYSLPVPLLHDAKSQLPQAICELTPGSINRNLLINRDKPPFDNRDLR